MYQADELKKCCFKSATTINPAASLTCKHWKNEVCTYVNKIYDN